MAKEDELPWYLDFAKIFIIIGVIAAGILVWFAAGTPGAPLKSGDYSCLNPSSFDAKQQAETQINQYVYNPFEDQWIATVENGQLSRVVLVPGKKEILEAPRYLPATSFSIVKKIDRSTFRISVDGSSAICWF